MQLARRRIAIVRSTDRVGMHEATGGSERTVRRGTRGSLASQSRMRVYKGRMSCAMRFGDASAHTMTDAHNVHITAAWPWTDAVWFACGGCADSSEFQSSASKLIRSLQFTPVPPPRTRRVQLVVQKAAAAAAAAGRRDLKLESTEQGNSVCAGAYLVAEATRRRWRPRRLTTRIEKPSLQQRGHHEARVPPATTS